MTRPLDRDRLRSLLGVISESVRQLDELGRLSEEHFLADFKHTESAKYLLIKATEAAIDTCNHLVARMGGRAPRDYADCFAVLEELDVLPAELTSRLRQMARFRNLLVHMYQEVDDRRVYRILRESLGDLEEYSRLVSRKLVEG